MSGVYIPGMEMPMNCFLCHLSYMSGERLFCYLTKEEVVRAKRAAECPLIPVPDHGRLIDADALYRRIKTECNPYGKPTIDYDEGNKVLHVIIGTPTIIPTDKEDGSE